MNGERSHSGADRFLPIAAGCHAALLALDDVGIGLNQQATAQLRCEHRLEIVSGAVAPSYIWGDARSGVCSCSGWGVEQRRSGVAGGSCNSNSSRHS